MRSFFLKSSLVFISFITVNVLNAQKNAPVYFQPNSQALDYITPIGEKGSFSLGFFADSAFPLASAFQSKSLITSKLEDMRKQVPVGFGVEAAYSLSNKLEIGLGVGFEFFETQQLSELTTTTNLRNYNILKYRFIPVTGLLRYRWPRKKWATEVELGLGAALGSITARSTDPATNEITNPGPFLRAHGAFGFAWSWAKNFSLHMQLGYAAQSIGEKTYALGGTNNHEIKQSSMLNGIYSKGFLRYYF